MCMMHDMEVRILHLGRREISRRQAKTRRKNGNGQHTKKRGGE